MKSKRILLLGIMVFMVLFADAQKRKEALTTPVRVNYCLPKVAYDITVVLQCKQYIPGPYQSYAEKELGLRPRAESSQEWTIRDIKITPRYIPDEKAVYAISASGDYWPVFVRLSAEGFLAGVSGGTDGVFNEAASMDFNYDEELKEKVIDIMKINTYNHLKEVLDTNYTYQEVDGEMKKIWDPIVRYAPKTEQDNVKEAVSEIFRIRSERARLLGAENNVPDGKSLEIILKGFDEMEANYLSLFMGKEEKREVVRTFECVPEKAGESVVAFRFSREKGLSDSKDVTAQAYMLRIDQTVVPASSPVGGDNAEAAAIYYRVPAVGDLQLLRGNQILKSFPAIVPQLGEIKRFPIDVISNEGLALEFYPQYGALKSAGKAKN